MKTCLPVCDLALDPLIVDPCRFPAEAARIHAGNRAGLLPKHALAAIRGAGMVALALICGAPIEGTARPTGRVSVGVSVGNPWVGGAGFCGNGPVYGGARWGGGRGGSGWGWGCGPAWTPVYPVSWAPAYPVYVVPPFYDAAPARSFSSVPAPGGWQLRPPSPGPAYIPLEQALENSRTRAPQKQNPRTPRAPELASPSAESRASKTTGIGAYPNGPTSAGHSRTARVQRTLKELGYYDAAIDGQTGPATQAAIRTYQIDRGLPVTGKIDPSLEKELGLLPEL